MTELTCPSCGSVIPAVAATSWECMGRKQVLPEPGECNWPDCGCDPHATKVIESLLEQGWGPRSFDSTTDWLPIETAPKDEGRHILLHGSGSNFTDCSFVGYWTTYKEKEPGWQMMSSKIHVEPTLWMPLPTVVSRPPQSPQDTPHE